MMAREGDPKVRVGAGGGGRRMREREDDLQKSEKVGRPSFL